MTEVTVTDADREAAERFGNAWRMNAAGKFGLANMFARHRIEAERRAFERAAEVAARMYVADPFRFEFGHEVATAIRALAKEG